MTVRAVRGFNDILPGTTEVWRRIEDEAAALFRAYGFSEIKVPVVERTELFARSIGEATDIVEKEMYTFRDRRGDSLTLRPEGTAPVVRAYIENKLYTAPVTRLFYGGPMFRYERPQKGRYRQFHQIGAEVLGDGSPWIDAETMEMAVRLFERLGVEGAELHVNTLGCAQCRPGYKAALKDFLDARSERLCADCRRRMETNPLRALDCKVPACVDATADAPALTDHVCRECAAHFDEVRRYLALLDASSTVNPRMVRGLDYYTRTTFEITAAGLGAQNAVAAGGRYDSLVRELGGPQTPCFGFALGMERLSLVLGERPAPPSPLYFIALGREAERAGTELVRGLRSAGLTVVTDYGEGSLRSRMKRAHRLGASRTLILGDDELCRGVVTVKEMATASQQAVPLAEAVSRLAGAMESRGAQAPKETV
ncbi:MAG TPA: histidine--tRNA ligase [Deltaproteobacteria bacterium]|nr:histidine--tRNA ligase [Deltaproteobacteria bacterium]